MCFLWGHIGGVRKEYKKYMFFKHFKSPKMRCRFHSNFKEYIVFKMKTRVFDAKTRVFIFLTCIV